MIYFIQIGVDGPIKIGLSDNPQKRFAQLQTASPYTLRLLHFEHGEKLREESLHSAFDDCRLRGEWFSPTSKLLNFINYLRDRGYGRDCSGEVCEPGDTVWFYLRGMILHGRVMGASPTADGPVPVNLEDGRQLNLPCNMLVVYGKQPPAGAWR